MAFRRSHIVPCAFALLVVAWMAAQTLTGTEMGLLYLAPALVLALPLILGRYVGEEQLAVLTTTSQASGTRAAADLPSPRSHVRVMHRGGRLVASAMAKRPPPGRALHATA